MNPQQARRTLLDWRPPPDPGSDPHPAQDPTRDPHSESHSEHAAALASVAADPQLAAWFEAHRQFQTGVRLALRAIPVPPELSQRLAVLRSSPASLAPSPVIVRPVFQRARWLLATAALLAALATALAFLFLRPPADPGFEIFRDRMARAAIREYRMDLESPDLEVIRNHLRTHAAPSEFVLPPALNAATPVGGGILSWQGRPVSMICLRAPDVGMLYLFVTESKVAGAPALPALGQTSRLVTASWTADSRVFVLAAATSPEVLKRFLPEERPTKPGVRGELTPPANLVPVCRAHAQAHGGPAQQPVVVGTLVVR
ncbi:MAG: hypothetical protein IT580_12430 [Verrucomicrobiales bacterium]|nr:hypothetical protein [Verrucomicrobiales bacterium]